MKNNKKSDKNWKEFQDRLMDMPVTIETSVYCGLLTIFREGGCYVLILFIMKGLERRYKIKGCYFLSNVLYNKVVV